MYNGIVYFLIDCEFIDLLKIICDYIFYKKELDELVCWNKGVKDLRGRKFIREDGIV